MQWHCLPGPQLRRAAGTVLNAIVDVAGHGHGCILRGAFPARTLAECIDTTEKFHPDHSTSHARNRRRADAVPHACISTVGWKRTSEQQRQCVRSPASIVGSAFFGVVQVLAAGGVWRDVGRLPESALAQQIRHDEIDILVELTGRQGMRLTVGHTQHPVLPKSACACWPCLTRHRGKDGMVAP